MSVIAKLQIHKVTSFGHGALTELGCIAANETMAAYAGSEEDKLFTKYSPWGEMKLLSPEWFAGPGQDVSPLGKAAEMAAPASNIYAVVMAKTEMPDDFPLGPVDHFPGALVYGLVSLQSMTMFGGDSKQVAFVRSGGATTPSRMMGAFGWKMSIDNPGASDQLKPGEDYWVALYSADANTRDQVIAAAHKSRAPLVV